MYCNGACCFCSVPCSREIKGNNKKISTNSVIEESIGTYEVKKNLFGKEKVRKVKNETGTLDIEYIERR